MDSKIFNVDCGAKMSTGQPIRAQFQNQNLTIFAIRSGDPFIKVMS